MNGQHLSVAIEEIEVEAYGVGCWDEVPALVVALVRVGDACTAGVVLVVGKLVVRVLMIARYLVGLIAALVRKVLVVCVQIRLCQRYTAVILVAGIDCVLELLLGWVMLG